jgi:hypothetical protein
LALGSIIYQAAIVYQGKLDHDDWGGDNDLEQYAGIENLG